MKHRGLYLHRLISSTGTGTRNRKKNKLRWGGGGGGGLVPRGPAGPELKLRLPCQVTSITSNQPISTISQNSTEDKDFYGHCMRNLSQLLKFTQDLP